MSEMGKIKSRFGCKGQNLVPGAAFAAAGGTILISF